MKPKALQFAREQMPSWFFTINRIWIGVLFTTLLATLALSTRTNAVDPITIEGLLRCTNAVRLENGQSKLYLSDQLSTAAAGKLEDMEKYKYWAHKNPETGSMGWEFIDAAGYYYKVAGENLAIGYNSSEKVCEAWERSASHFANMIDPKFQEVGFAFKPVILDNGKSGTLVVQHFATKMGFETDFRNPPACKTRIDPSLYVKSPACDITEPSKRIVLYNPRRHKVEISIDGKKVNFTEKNDKKEVIYELDQPFSFGSHEISIKKLAKNNRPLKNTAEIRVMVQLPEEQTVSTLPISSLLDANLLGSGNRTSAALMIGLLSILSLGTYFWRTRRK